MHVPNPRRETLGFKDASKKIKSQIKELGRIANDDERQQRFEDLKTAVDKVMEKPNIQRAVEKPTSEKDGHLADLGPVKVGAGVFVGGAATVGTVFPGVAILAPFILPAIGILAAVSVVTVFAGRHLLRRSRAKELGLTKADIKYAHKMKKQQRKVNAIVMDLRTDDEVQESIKELSEQFTASAARAERKKTRQARRQQPAVPARKASPGA